MSIRDLSRIRHYTVGFFLFFAMVTGTGGTSVEASTAASWFWKEVPAKIAKGQRSHALAVIRKNRAKSRISKARVANVLRRWRPQIAAGARRGRIPEALLAAIVTVESAGKANAKSHAGAMGLAQLMPGTAARFGVKNAYNPAQNLMGAGAYLKFLMKRFRGDIVLVLAAYNAGEGAVDRFGGVPPYRETRDYVPKVLAAYDHAQQLTRRYDSSQEAKKWLWFWETVPPKRRDGSRSGALDFVRAEKAGGRKMFGAKRSLNRVISKWRGPLQDAARKGKVSEALLAAIVAASGANPRSIGPTGGQGLAHLPGEITQRYRIKDPFDPAQNLAGAARYLSDLLNLYRGDLVLALAAYNAGPEAVKQHGGVPPYAETRVFVPKVLSAFAVAGTFCTKPPEAPRRQCVLK